MRLVATLFVLGALLALQGSHAQEDTAPASVKLDLGTVQAQVLDATGHKVLAAKGTYPAKLLASPQLSAQHSLQVTLSVTASGGQPFKPTQVFLAFQHKTTGAVAYVVGKQGKAGAGQAEAPHVLDAPVPSILSQIGAQAGEYEVSLVVGDAGASNSLAWDLGPLEVVLEPEAGAGATPALKTVRLQPTSGLKPPIAHLFRAPEKRPPPVVSVVVAFLVALPLIVVLMYVAFGLGVNNKAWPKKASTAGAALAFHGMLASLLGVYLQFWTQWNLAQTLPVVLFMGLGLALVGHRALSGLASERLAAASKKD